MLLVVSDLCNWYCVFVLSETQHAVFTAYFCLHLITPMQIRFETAGETFFVLLFEFGRKLGSKHFFFVLVFAFSSCCEMPLFGLYANCSSFLISVSHQFDGVSEAEGLKFKFRASQIEHSVANGSPPLRHFFERSCVARAH